MYCTYVWQIVLYIIKIYVTNIFSNTAFKKTHVVVAQVPGSGAGLLC
jgi:hypothetical protein